MAINIKKSISNKKVILGVAGMISMVVLIAVTSFIPLLIDPSRWQTVEFLTDELIICAIVIFSMVSTIFIGMASNGSDPNSLLAKSRVKFFDSIKLVLDTNRFRQWIKKVLQAEDDKEIEKRILTNAGIEDLSVMKLDNVQLKALIKKPQKFDDRYYKTITKEQFKIIKKIRKGKFKIDHVAPEYYLSVNGLTDNRTVSERATSESKKKVVYTLFNVVSRLIITVIIAMIFASLGRDLASSNDMSTAWVKFASRMWSMISSSFMGFMVGNKINDIDSEYINLRSEIHIRYSQDNNFVGLTQQEEAKEEFVNRVKEENKQYAIENNLIEE